MLWFLAFLYLLAAVLPSVGLFRLFTDTGDAVRSLVEHFNARGKLGTSTVEEIEARDLLAAARAVHNSKTDLALVGSGLLCGAIASILSLFT